jgi:AcrR family transcriptional regulator
MRTLCMETVGAGSQQRQLIRPNPEWRPRDYVSALGENGRQFGPKMIIDVAERLFRHIGHENTKIGDIAGEVGKSRASIYQMFPSRDSIKYHVYARWAQVELDVFEEAAGDCTSANAKIAAVIATLNSRARQRLTCDPNVHALWLAAAVEDWDVHRAYYRDLTTGIVDILLLDSATHQLPLPQCLKIASAVVTAMVCYLHPLLLKRPLDKHPDIDAELASQIRFIANGLILSGSCRL